MRRNLVLHSSDRVIGLLAARQHGAVSRAQLLERGLSANAIDARVKNGALYKVYRGVYAAGHPALTTHGRFLAAVLSCGSGAALSHTSAAVLWGLARERGPRIDVTVPRGGERRRRGALVIHRSQLGADEITIRDRIPVTTPARTLLDLADVLTDRGLERALDEAAYLRLDVGGLRPVRGRRGAGRLARVLARHEPGATRTRSPLEETVLAMCRSAGLAVPAVNVRVAGHEVDFAWTRERLIVETDGWAGHGTRTAFERDRRRDAQLLAVGWRVLRVTRTRLQGEPGRVATEIAAALGAPT